MSRHQHLIFCLLAPIVSIAVLIVVALVCSVLATGLQGRHFVTLGQILGNMLSLGWLFIYLFLMVPAFIASCLFKQMRKAQKKYMEWLWLSGVVFFIFMGPPLAVFYMDRTPFTAIAAVLATALTIAVCGWLSTPKALPSPAVNF